MTTTTTTTYTHHHHTDDGQILIHSHSRSHDLNEGHAYDLGTKGFIIYGPRHDDPACYAAADGE